MRKKHSLTLDNDFITYCELNKIENIDSLAKKVFQRGFTIEKYGETPTTAKGVEKIIEKEVIKEVPVEKIVEIIKEVEVIKEVPIEKIVEVIKEVPVEIKGDTQVVTKEVVKEVVVEKIIWDKPKEKELDDLRTENDKLKKELNNITDTLEKMNKAKYLKGSDLNNLYDE
jgi:hypothetical protein